jgi:hypothetical protein
MIDRAVLLSTKDRMLRRRARRRSSMGAFLMSHRRRPPGARAKICFHSLAPQARPCVCQWPADRVFVAPAAPLCGNVSRCRPHRDTGAYVNTYPGDGLCLTRSIRRPDQREYTVPGVTKVLESRHRTVRPPSGPPTPPCAWVCARPIMHLRASVHVRAYTSHLRVYQARSV